ncbi:transporter substrate-binding domain-containing protein [Nocardia sp. NPDC049220]|uniref:transporter substrate-binding domain-containing protein n=1 Tax=Nocardia sp. NPDC049220 TaxID=3155273 RepID=UPI0033E28A4F
MRRKLFVVAMLAVVAAGGLTACAGSDPNVLKVGTEGVYAPFTFQGADGKLSGYDVDVAQAVGDRLGKKVEFVQTPWEAIFAGLESKRFDLVANQVTVNEERAAKYALSMPYTTSTGVIVTRADNTAISTLADLKGKTCAQVAVSNWTTVSAEAGARIEAVEGFVQAIQLLKAGRVDATVNDSLVVAEYMKKTGDTSVQVAGRPGAVTRQAFVARKGDAVVTEVDMALDKLRADGTLAKISEKYFGTDVSQ